MLNLRSILFVPGSRPDRYPKALATAASVVCIDLEDSVPADAKEQARQSALEFVRVQPSSRLAIRINRLGSTDGLRDLLALGEVVTCDYTVLIPKVESATEMRIVRSVLPPSITSLVASLETCRGLQAATEIARAGASALLFGGGDYAAELGMEMSWENLLSARVRVLEAGAAAGVPAIDVPSLHLDDFQALELECARSRSLGYDAKAAIHPSQVDPINRHFEPTEDEKRAAAQGLEAFRRSGGGAVRAGGFFLEEPVLRRLLRRAGMSAELVEVHLKGQGVGASNAAASQ